MAPAKINLVLRVHGRRRDGYHDVDTIVQQLDFGDEVVVALTARPGVALDVSAEPGCDPGSDRSNLAYRAALAFLAASGCGRGAAIRLRKRIPVGAGLGGGSSDAAAVLRALNRLTGGVLSTDTLLGIGAELGSDVPAFLTPSPLALARGRGDLVTPLRPLPVRRVQVIYPGVAVSTARAYASLGRSLSAGAFPPLDLPRSWEEVEALAQNDFESAASAQHPRIARTLAALRASGCRPVLLSGSGSACFGLACPTIVNPSEPGFRSIEARTLTEPPPVNFESA